MTIINVSVDGETVSMEIDPEGKHNQAYLAIIVAAVIRGIAEKFDVPAGNVFSWVGHQLSDTISEVSAVETQ